MRKFSIYSLIVLFLISCFEPDTKLDQAEDETQTEEIQSIKEDSQEEPEKESDSITTTKFNSKDITDLVNKHYRTGDLSVEDINSIKEYMKFDETTFKEIKILKLIIMQY